MTLILVALSFFKYAVTLVQVIGDPCSGKVVLVHVVGDPCSGSFVRVASSLFR